MIFAMNFIPLLPNWAEIVSLCVGYTAASIDISRRLSWHWDKRSSHYDPAYQIGAWATSFFAMPVALVLLRNYTSQDDDRDPWNKPPRNIRKEQSRKHLESERDRLERENKRLERKLGLFLDSE